MPGGRHPDACRRPPSVDGDALAGTLLLGFAGPLFQPVGLRPVAAARRETGGVYDEPGEDRVGVVPPANIDARSNSRKDWRDRA